MSRRKDLTSLNKKLFEYEHTSKCAEYYEILETLLFNGESELVEFKEAKSNYDADKIGRYFSAISNEANLRQRQYGWLVFGVRENNTNIEIIGTSFKEGNSALLENFKFEIAKGTANGITFYDIIEIFPIVNGLEKRVLMFKIPAAATGIPTDWKNNYYERNGDSLTALKQNKIDIIRAQERRDWSKQILEGASIEHLDKVAIALAKQKYKEKMNRSHISNEIDDMSDVQFLTKIKLIINNKITNAGMLLLGNSDYDYLFHTPPEIMWRLYGSDNMDKDYTIFKIPFINIVDRVFSKIRNLTYRYMPNQLTLFPIETEQYDGWLIRELLNNCIAHTNYQLGGRIYVNEFEDKIKFTNPGDFIPQKIENVLEASYSPPFYRNQLLAETMVAFHMIDTASMGIRRTYNILKSKYFPMPDYNIATGTQVDVNVYGKILNDNYMHILFDNPTLDLQTVFLLDRIQKGLAIDSADGKKLKTKGLIEGRSGRYYLSASISKSIEESGAYIKNKGFDDKYYKDLIIEYLKQYKKAYKKDIRKLLWEKLPDSLSDKQKEYKIGYLLASLKKQNLIMTSSSNQQKSYWTLKTLE